MISRERIADLEQTFEQKSLEHPTPTSVFTLKTREIKTSIRNNGLYQLVKDLCSQTVVCQAESKESAESSLLADYRVSSLASDRAWLIHFKKTPENVFYLEPGFEFQSSHLRVDALFAKENTLKAKQGFSACHYTEEYKNPHTNALMVVHAYIGKNGIISYQIKKYTSEDDKINEQGEALLVTSVLREIIQKNSEPAVELAGALEKERCDRYTKAQEKSYEIDAELNAVLQKILIDDSKSNNRLTLKTNYKKLLDSFLIIVETINRYSHEEVDQRGELLQTFYGYMNRSVIAPKTIGVKETTEKQLESPDSLDDVAKSILSIKIKTKEELQLEEDKARAIVLITEIKKLMKDNKSLLSRKNLKIDELISRKEFKETITLKLIELAFLSGEVSREENNYLKTIVTTLNNIPNLLKIFEQFVEYGEINSVIQLYNYVQYENLMPVFRKLLQNLVEFNGERVVRLRAVAEFFFENSNSYRNYIRVHEQLLISRGGLTCSFLVDAFLKENYFTFELMLKHGFNPNGIGIACQEVTASATYAIAYLMSTNLYKLDERYIKALLNFGALLDKKTPNLTWNITEACSSIAAAKQSKKNLKKNKIRSMTAQQFPTLNDQEDFDAFSVKAILGFDSVLEVLCGGAFSPSLELLELFAPESSLSSLAVSFALLINVPEVTTRFVIGTEERLFVCCNREAADRINEVLPGLRPAHAPMDKKHVAVIASHVNPEKEDLWCKSVELLIKFFLKKYDEVLEQDPTQIDKIDGSLMEKAKATENLCNKVNFLKAALYLQLSNPHFSFNNAQKIVQRFCHLGQAVFYHRLFDPQSQIRCNAFFSHAFVCCKTLACSTELQKTPLYKFTVERLKLLGKISENFESASEPKEAVDISLTLAAQRHVKQTPSLRALASNESKPVPVVAETPSVDSSEKNPTKKEKKKKKR